MDRLKEIISSRTHWFNVVLLLLASGEMYAPLLKPVLGEQTYAVLFFVCAFGNHVLRELTRAKSAK